ncbi:unnamed protein product [Rotaria sordida]|uniref:Serine/threonine-protein kinase PLK n=1 Tax=Rotaria sordida TaxID=392033 RepID=A0A819RSR2_9BILA|nr:unnamed protein product [Rotaria sordida]CAF4050851.1 unnamed protein product [Rotaria sordida]
MESTKDEFNIPNVIIDPRTRTQYSKGKFLGKGGFARCYELIDVSTGQAFAGKVVPKSMLVKPHQKEKMQQEVTIHQSLNHKHIVQFFSYFEDENNVYIVLELCRRRSLMELHRRRKTVTEPETRYFVKQIVEACIYLHDKRIIHRDLKLGNLFLNDQMEIKIGDFGLATRIENEADRKRTLCGTPNYIAPEVINKKGHSYEVDVWSLGCILYTLLLGKPPFETSSLKDTYSKIRKNDYLIPENRISRESVLLIQRCLRHEPYDRPTMAQIYMDTFFSGFTPATLPTSVCTVAPRYSVMAPINQPQQPIMINTNKVTTTILQQQQQQRRPFTEQQQNEQVLIASRHQQVVTLPTPILMNERTTDVHGLGGRIASAIPNQTDIVLSSQMARQLTGLDGQTFVPTNGMNEEINDDLHLAIDLQRQLEHLIQMKPNEKIDKREDEAEDPASAPMLWISKWVDYSDKYGLGYQLCDDSVGVLFNDSTRLIMTAGGAENLQYIDRDGYEHLCTMKDYSDQLKKKVTLLKYFTSYMDEHLLKAGAAHAPRPGDELSRLPFVKSWFRTRNAIVFYLSNGTLQINFFQDHTKVVLCPLMSAVTYINEHREIRTYRLAGLEQCGCSKQLFTRIKYAKSMIDRILAAKSNQNRLH